MHFALCFSDTKIGSTTCVLDFDKTGPWSQEELQKEAFEALQCQKDARHKRMTSQISLIECELAELTMLEIEQRDMRLDTQMVRNYAMLV